MNVDEKGDDCLFHSSFSRTADRIGRDLKTFTDTHPTLVIVGSGATAQATAWLADKVSFQVIVIEDRPEYIRQTDFPPDTDWNTRPLKTAIDEIHAGVDTFCAILGRDRIRDFVAANAALRRPFAFVGMTGNQSKINDFRSRLQIAGVSVSALDHFYAPIGLKIGSATDDEIAVSIVAQLIGIWRNGIGRFPRDGSISTTHA